MAFGFLALIVASTLLAFYRYTFTLEEILADAVGEHPTADLESYRERNTRSHLTAGRYGVLALTLGVVLTVGASTVAGTPALWEDVNNVFDLLQTLEFWMRLVLFGALSLAATGVGVLFVFLSWQGGMQGMDGEYGTIVRRFGMRVSSVALLSVPLLILGSVVLMPAETLSGVLFLMLALGLAFLLLTAQFLYAFRRDGASRYTAYAFFALALALTVIFTKDQMAIGNATRVQAVRLALQNDKDFEDLKARLGIALVSMSGQEIYDAKCSACHLFDQKKVGPPYKSVLPKYADRKAALIAFVLNPAKVDPAYPNMPNQGLKPAEADSIATWLLSKFAPAKTAPAAAVPAAPGTKPQ
jgi:cytochrome c